MEKKPRSYGNGSLYKTSDNRWVVKVSLGSGPDGKPITKRFSARTKAEAEQKLRSFRNDQRKSETASPIHFSVQDYSDYWLKTYQFQKLKPLSFNCLEGAVQNHIFPRLGKMNFGSVSRDDIQQLINDLYHKEHLSYIKELPLMYLSPSANIRSHRMRNTPTFSVVILGENASLN